MLDERGCSDIGITRDAGYREIGPAVLEIAPRIGGRPAQQSRAPPVQRGRRGGLRRVAGLHQRAEEPDVGAALGARTSMTSTGSPCGASFGTIRMRVEVEPASGA